MPRPAKAPATPAERATRTRIRAKNQPAAAPRLLIRSSSIHAAGCYTLDPVRRGARILEYDGPRLSKKLADERYANRIVTYLFGFGDNGDVIDGFGTGMFLNHSCAPNCESADRNGRVFITAIRDIAAGEELVYEYNLYDSDLADTADCYCGAAHCRGTMYSSVELKRRARAFARQSRKVKSPAR
jgi:SET domain-containing protein